MIFENRFTYEKEFLKKILEDSSMNEIIYSETFSLIFYKTINNAIDGYNYSMLKMNLIIDAPIWVGSKTEWDKLICENNEIMEMEDKIIAEKLIELRYNNQIQVKEVKILEDYLCIEVDDNIIISIAHNANSDYSWILEEYGNKKMQDKMMIFCQGRELIAKNISEDRFKII